MNTFPQIHWQLPDWVAALIDGWQAEFETETGRMSLAVALARHNIESGTGGPFGAAVFDLERHQLVAPGVNLVTQALSSSAHAEVVALSIAQQVVGQFDLASVGRFELVTSAEPCAMCLGAVPWSGVVSVVCGAHAADAEAVGFDEGDRPAEWTKTLARRGIAVKTGVERAAAKAVLDDYLAGGGAIYNGRQMSD
jgi:tRNA(Arg) A34 adenosine deaminase TadA